MRSAIDKYTRTCVDAELALAGRPYICACCEAPVIVRVGSERAAHFAHKQGRAREDCEQYFPAAVTHTGRPSRPLPSQVREDQELSYLCCVDSEHGLELALCLPPAGETDWSGSIRFEAQDYTRTLRRAHLERGMTIPFALRDGQWNISVHGEVDELYLARIEVGRRSLELERNLFHATSRNGRTIAPVDSVQLGDSIWWIRKSKLELDLRNIPHVEAVLDSHTHGWYVYLITLPQLASPDELAKISNWLQRRVRPRRPIAWIDSPWPRAVRNDGTVVYSISDGAMRFQSDRPVDLRIASPSTNDDSVNVSEVTEFIWPNPIVGDWEVWVDDIHTSTFQISALPIPSGSAVVAEVSAGRMLDIAELQRFVRTQISEGAPTAPIAIRWRTPEIAHLIRLNGHQPSDPGTELNLEMTAGVTVDAGHFGYAEWPAAHRAPISSSSREILKSRDLAQWLASVGSAIPRSGHLSLRVSRLHQEQDPLLRQLSRLFWPHTLSGQVRQLAKELEGQK